MGLGEKNQTVKILKYGDYDIYAKVRSFITKLIIYMNSMFQKCTASWIIKNKFEAIHNWDFLEKN